MMFQNGTGSPATHGRAKCSAGTTYVATIATHERRHARPILRNVPGGRPAALVLADELDDARVAPRLRAGLRLRCGVGRSWDQNWK